MRRIYMLQAHRDDSPAVALAQRLAAEFAARAHAADRSGRLPPEDIQSLQSSGYLALNVPAEYGGQGLSMAECVAAHLELAQGSASTAMVAAMQLQIFGHARDTHPWPAPIYERFCRAAAGGALFNSVASEPQLGSPSRGGLFQTRLVPDPEGPGWLLNGHKTWTTGGRHLTHMLVRATVEAPDELPVPGVALVLQDTPGVEWVETWGDSLSLRASESHDVRFHAVRIPTDGLIERGRGPQPPHPNAWFPMLISTTYLGAAIAARNTVIRYALERVPSALGKPIATLPKIQRQIGEIDLALQAARSLLCEAAALWQGDPQNRARVYPRVVAAKHLATETAAQVTAQALRIAGGVSITTALPLERYFRDVQAGSMQPPSGDTALEIIGQQAIAEIQARDHTLCAEQDGLH